MAKTRHDLYKLHKKLAHKALSLMSKKNADYAAQNDPYKNFRTFGRFGILVRLSDKLSRLQTFEERGRFSVKDESVEDTALDILNYVVLYMGYEDDHKTKPNKRPVQRRSRKG